MGKKAKPKSPLPKPAPAAAPALPIPPSPPLPIPTEPKNRWRDLIALDARSLGLFRIGLGLFLIIDLLMRVGDLATFYSDEGVLPRLARIRDYDLTDTTGQKNWFTLYLISGGVWYAGLHFIISAVFAFMLMVGYRTRLAAVASFVLLASLQSRTPLILDGGDTMIRCALFWAIFLPLNARFSVDRRLRPEPPGPVRVANLASFALIAQVASIYLFGAIQKSDPIWTRDYTALYYAISLECFSTRFGELLLDFPVLLKLLTFLAWWLELLGPIALFIPFGTPWIRLGAVLAFWGFHLGTAVTLHLSLFPFIGCLVWVPLLPALVWERDRWPGRWLVPGIERRLRPVRDAVERLLSRSADFLKNPERCDYRPGRWATALVACLWLYVLVWNLREVWPVSFGQVMPYSANGIGRGLRIDQDWKLFAPYPTHDDGWYVFKGVLKDGTEVNLWEPGRPLSWAKPASVAESYVDRRWRKYLMNLYGSDYAHFRPYLAYWLAARWEAEQPGRRVSAVEIHRMAITVPPPGQPRPKAKDELLYVLPMGP